MKRLKPTDFVVRMNSVLGPLVCNFLVFALFNPFVTGDTHHKEIFEYLGNAAARQVRNKIYRIIEYVRHKLPKQKL